ncbi:S8 family serine peptidase [Salinibacter ruber]|uniref:S8 family serine peptidase n=1 Tax=Salinibacter ruber TaxID=146919 RepID=UPI0013C31B76|nr:S8 family serine peptidase [Salinibacter ruber]
MLACIGLAGPTWAQEPSQPTLSSAERSKLDGRFERILRKAQSKKLKAEIQNVKKLAQRDFSSESTSKKTGQEEDKLKAQDLARQLQSRKNALDAENELRFPSAMDVRPDGHSPSGEPVYSAIVKTKPSSNLQVQGVTVVSTIGNFATVRATPTGLKSLVQLETVIKVRTPRTAEAQNDVGAAEVGARTLNGGAVGGTEYKGQGTLTCIIDSGIDWSHPDFTDEKGNTRIRAIWDQVDDSTSTSTPEQNDPSRFRPDFNPIYGSEYLRSDIQAALDENGSVNQEDVNGHGTHVAGTAASSGEAYRRSSGAKRYRGAAPRADIIAVKAGDGPYPPDNVVNGVIYCQDVAEAAGKPVVINMSLGTNSAPHDGSSFFAQAMEKLSRPGSVIVAAAGNNGSPSNPIHTQKSLEAGGSVDVGIDVTQYTPKSGALNDFYSASLWTYEPGPYRVSVFTPDKQDSLAVTVDDSQETRNALRDTPQGRILFESSTNGNGRYFKIGVGDIAEDTPPGEGEWTVRIRHQGNSATPVHGWFLQNELGDSQNPSAYFAQADNRFTVASPATSKGVIAVGNYTLRTRWAGPNGADIRITDSPKGVITPSSSRGPTLDRRTKPAVSAPGRWVPSALSDDASPSLEVLGVSLGVLGDGEHQMLTGTSMAAPLTAGSIALLMQEDPTLSTDEARSLLKSTARVDGLVQARGGPPNQTFGAGKLNALRALTSLTGESAPLEVLSYHEPAGYDEDASITLGSGAAEQAALRFTPTQSGRVSGTHLSLAPNEEGDPANELTDSLEVEVWTDEGGVPGRQIGSSVAVPPSALRGFSPNFIRLSSTGVAVEAGEDYHLVVEEANTGTVELLIETVAPTAGRSKAFENGSWSPVGNDLVARVQVRTDVSAPPAVAGLGIGSAEPESIPLSWNGVSTSDLGGYLVYRDTSPIGSSPDLAPFDTTEATENSYTDTTAAEGRTYYYRVAPIDRSENEGALSGEASAFLYPSQVQAELNRSFGEASGPGDYRLVALPGEAGRPLSDVISGEAGSEWQAYRDDGSQEDFFQKFDGSDNFTFEPGNGFWVTATSALKFEDSISTISLQGDSAATVSLREGWNVISNPTDKSVEWARVRQANGAIQPPFDFRGSTFNKLSPSDSLKSAASGRAYYLFNDSPDRTELLIPYPGSPPSPISKTESRASSTAGQEANLLSLSATPVGSEGPTSTVQVGVQSETSRSVVAPPTRFEAVSLRIKADEKQAGRSGLLMTERRKGDGETFRLQLKSQEGVPVSLSASGLGETERQSVALIRPSAGKTYRLRADETVQIEGSQDGTALRLAVGTEGYVDEQADQVIPDEVTLTSYPNPVQKQATVEYTLPERADVRVALYDVLGRRVVTLEEGSKQAGRHRIQLERTGLSSGVYFGRLEAGDKTRTQKITVVR